MILTDKPEEKKSISLAQRDKNCAKKPQFSKTETNFHGLAQQEG